MARPIVFFDIGATLIEGPPQAPARFLEAALGLDTPARKRLNQRLLTTALETPAALADLLRADFGIDAARATAAAREVWETQACGPTIVKGAREALELVAALGLRTGFISNIWHPYAQTFERLFGQLGVGDVRVYSYRAGIAKPDVALYRQACAEAGCAAHDCLMIGDSYDNDIEPALGLGMRAIWLLHRPAKEQAFQDDVAAGRRPRPHLVLPSIATLSADHLTDRLIATS